MNANRAIITIGREYGSGGHDIGQIVAEKLGLPFYDKEILTLAAKNSGICEELFASHDEKATPSYLFSLMADTGEMHSLGGGDDMPLNQRIFMAQFETITRIAAQGPCVIVGRCANYVLKNLPNLVSVFIYADPAARIQRIMQVEKLNFNQAKERVHKVDKQRQTYYNFFADGNWGHRSNYHMMLNTTALSHATAAECIITYLGGRE